MGVISTGMPAAYVTTVFVLVVAVRGTRGTGHRLRRALTRGMAVEPLNPMPTSFTIAFLSPFAVTSRCHMIAQFAICREAFRRLDVAAIRPGPAAKIAATG